MQTSMTANAAGSGNAEGDERAAGDIASTDGQTDPSAVNAAPAAQPVVEPSPHAWGSVFDGVIVRFVHPTEDDEAARLLRAEGLAPLMVNERFLTGATEDDLQRALDEAAAMEANAAQETRATLLEMVTGRLGRDDLGDGEALELDRGALSLFAHALAACGYVQADTAPFCAAGFARGDLVMPVMRQLALPETSGASTKAASQAD